MWVIPVLIPVLAAFAILVSPVWCVTGNDSSWCGHGERRDNRKRFAIFLVVSFILTGLIAFGLFTWASSKMWYKEVWNNKIVTVKYEEKWTTKEQKSRQVPDGTETYYTGSGKNRRSHTRTKYRTEYYYVTETHGPYFNAHDDQGEKHGINSGIYAKWKKVWANEKKTGEHRGSSAGFDRAITGGIFESYWPKTFETMYPWASIHKYKNKVRQAPSVLNLGEPTEELVKKYPRPADRGNTSPIVYYGGKRFSEEDLLYLRRVNAKLGAQCQVHTIMVVFGADSPRSVVSDVLTAWQGPNKNELVTFISLGGQGPNGEGGVNWCEVHSWMDNTELHGIVLNEGIQGPFSVWVYGETLLRWVPRRWRRKEFEDFEYLKVNIHWGWTVGALTLSIVVVFFVYFVLDGGISRMAERHSDR